MKVHVNKYSYNYIQVPQTNINFLKTIILTLIKKIYILGSTA